MLTSSLITMAQKEFKDWSRVMILGFLNELQRIIFTQNTIKHMRMYDITTGKDPIISTVSGTFEYHIPNAWRVCEVYEDDIDRPTNVMLFDATLAEEARIVFSDNPNTGSYYYRAYKFPDTLVTEDVQLSVPESFHTSHVYEGLAGLLEKMRSGKSERWEKFEKILLPDIIKKMSDHKDTVFYVQYKGY